MKVERPGAGDDTRGWGPPFAQPAAPGGERESAYFLSINRGKRSVALDLKDGRDLDRVRDLVRPADVLAENFRRPGVMESLGLGEAALRGLNERLVVLSITGFGEGRRRGTAPVSIRSSRGRGPDGHHRPGRRPAEQGRGPHRRHPGRHVRRDRCEGAPWSSATAPAAASGSGPRCWPAWSPSTRSRGRAGWWRARCRSLGGNRHPTIAPYGAYDCADGGINIAVGSEGLWRRFAPLVGIDADDDRFATNGRVARVDELEAEMAPALAAAGVDEWMGRLDAAGVPAGRIRSIDEVYASERVAHLGLIDEVEHPSLGRILLPGAPVRFGDRSRTGVTPPPTLGQHTADPLWDDEP